MGLDSVSVEAANAIRFPEHAFQAWVNGRLTIEKMSLSESERALKWGQNNQELKELLVEKLTSYTWTARAFYNVIEEHYPGLNPDEGQKRERKVLMRVLQDAMKTVEDQRFEERKFRKETVFS